MIVEETFEETFLDTPHLLVVAVSGSDFQKDNDIRIDKVDAAHYQITLAVSKATENPNSQIAVEVQNPQRFKAKGRPKDVCSFANALLKYKQAELDRLRAEAGVFREEKTLTREEIQRFK